MKTLRALTDPVYQPSEQLSAFDQWMLKYIHDKRDLPFARLTLRISLTLLPLAVLLYVPGLPGWAWWPAAVASLFLNNIRFKGPFGLMLHCTSHRILFKKQYGWMNHYLPWVLAPLFGQTPETYFSHHMGMHHAENNMPADTSSTMHYQRDSVRGFLHYLGTFLFVGIFQLARYFIRTGKSRLLLRSVRGEALYFLLCIGLWFVNWQATLVVFVLPFLISRVIMMLGNWTQHAFVDAEDPTNEYRNSITCINTKYNHKCWNDGYHASHHLRPALHWTEHPLQFTKNVHEYAANDAIVFDGIHFLHTFAWLMTKRYDLMAKHFVNLGGRYQSDAEIIELLKTRTRKIPRLQQRLAAA
ncbi:hypothetical protein GCM10027048_29840 [Hymenobacter coalescens]